MFLAGHKNIKVDEPWKGAFQALWTHDSLEGKDYIGKRERERERERESHLFTLYWDPDVCQGPARILRLLDCQLQICITDLQEHKSLLTE